MTSDVISRFNRDTWWLAAGVLGTVIFAALMVAVQERQPKAVAKSSSSNGKMTPGPGSSVDLASTETSLQEIPSSQTEPAVSTPVLALTPETNRNDAQANPGSGTLALPKDSMRAIGQKARNAINRSSVASRSVVCIAVAFSLPRFRLGALEMQAREPRKLRSPKLPLQAKQ